ncbi:MAG: amidohydrolase [Firmicutes bacterium]|nr:amidohydrolase [Bacillota bacterium]
MKSIITIVLAMNLMFQPITGMPVNQDSFIYTHAPQIFTDYTRPAKIREMQKAYVAHAGGGLGDMTGLNCREAMEESYEKGFRLIEMDVVFTSDGVPVMMHSWDGDGKRLFGEEKGHIYSAEEFKSFEMINGWHQMTLDDVVTAMCLEFPDMYLVTDTKENNYHLLNYLKEHYPGMEKRFIVQVYDRDEYEFAAAKGFPNIIYTLYRTEDTKEEVLEFCKDHPVYAITTYSDWMDDGFPEALREMGVYTYIHTINSEEAYRITKNHRYRGVYTDSLFDLEGLL